MLALFRSPAGGAARAAGRLFAPVLALISSGVVLDKHRDVLECVVERERERERGREGERGEGEREREAGP